MAAAVKTARVDNNQQKTEVGAAQTVVMVAAGAEAAVAIVAAAAAAVAAVAIAAADAVAEAVAVASAEMAATVAMVMAIAGRGEDKREVRMWSHDYKIYNYRFTSRSPWEAHKINSLCVPERFFAHARIKNGHFVCVSAYTVKQITNLQSIYAYKKIQTLCKGKNLRTPSYAYMRVCV